MQKDVLERCDEMMIDAIASCISEFGATGPFLAQSFRATTSKIMSTLGFRRQAIADDVSPALIAQYAAMSGHMYISSVFINRGLFESLLEKYYDPKLPLASLSLFENEVHRRFNNMAKDLGIEIPISEVDQSQYEKDAERAMKFANAFIEFLDPSNEDTGTE
jgi:hypothetical protein